MKKILTILVLFVSNVFAQEVPPPPVTYTLDTTVSPLININNTINNGIPLNLGDDNISAITLPFSFNFFGNMFDTAYVSSNGFLSFTNHGHGCCAGVPLPNTSWSNSIFGAWTDLNSAGNPYYRLLGNEFTVGWYNTAEYGTQNLLNFEISLFSNYDFRINYGNMMTLTGRPATAGFMGNNATDYTQILNGQNTSSLSNSTFTFNYNTPEPPPPEPVNCTLTPSDPSCIIQNITTPADTTTVANNTTTTQDTQEPTQETVVALATTENSSTSNEESTSTTEDANSRLPNATTINNDTPTTLASNDTQTASSLQAQDSSKPISDNISSSLLQLVLSIVETTSQPQENKTTTASNNSASATTETSSTSSATEETVAETQAGDLSMEILATGVAMNNASQQELQNNIQESLALTDQIIQAGTIENSSSNTSMVQDTDNIASVSSSDTDSITIEDNSTIIAENNEETKQESNNETTIEDNIVVVAENIEVETSQTTTDYTETTESQEVIASNEDSNTSTVEEAQQSTESIDDSDLLSIINSSQIASNNETEQTEEVAQPVVSNSVIEEDEKLASDNNKTFEDQSDTELLASILDNAGLAQTVMNTMQPYNYEPSITDREQLGVLGKKEEDKSDAEKKAEKIVAANKEEQENIKNNYFDADQSGILGAIAGDIDVSSYHSTMLPDNNVWYKPEEIYKNVTYKDNARGLYFLEKGSTDTYKKMVDSQYK